MKPALGVLCLLAMAPAVVAAALPADGSPRSRCMNKAVSYEKFVRKQLLSLEGRPDQIRTTTVPVAVMRGGSEYSSSSWGTTSVSMISEYHMMQAELERIMRRKAECARMSSKPQTYGQRFAAGRTGAVWKPLHAGIAETP